MLEHVLGEDLAVVFCGIASGYKSVREALYYAGGQNKFWGTLFRIGLTPRQLRAEEYGLVLAYDIGLTDLVQKKAGLDDELVPEDFDVEGFRRRVAESKPRIVAFNGKKAAKFALGVESVSYGKQQAKFEGADVFVLPSTSKNGHAYWDERPWRDLATVVKKSRRTGS